jgi:hypothetical protein
MVRDSFGACWPPPDQRNLDLRIAHRPVTDQLRCRQVAWSDADAVIIPSSPFEMPP